MFKKMLCQFSLFVLVALFLWACKPKEITAVVEAETSQKTKAEIPELDTGCESSEVFCVGLVTDFGKIDDKSFNQSAWEGVQRGKDELGVQAKYVETQDKNDYAANIALFAELKYDVIVTVGYALGTATREAALQYPDIDFIGVDQFQSEPVVNVTGLIFPEDQAGFLAGALAAMMSKTDSVAVVLGTDIILPVVAFKEGYQAGVQYINPSINLLYTYHPGSPEIAFADPDWGASIARQAIEQGADVIFGAGGNTGNGALIEAAKTPGLYCIGVDTDQWETLPEARPCLISSAMKLIAPGIYELLKVSVAGQLPPGNYVGQIGLAPFHDFDSVIPQEVKDNLNEIDKGLKDGMIQTGFSAER